ncbi:multiple epidermal growth factor-like domains protein 6 [Elysia marginata]|uniref:Multiple epidermal growth factor-like domains protein 6 n=1 Tax=Elysia marginata TaxID=1093978 RepID=A0AAV4GQ11_9GAST|nr:multiple epidermal growth factor-like domains protein 6 [Elysia marginata]
MLYKLASSSRRRLGTPYRNVWSLITHLVCLSQRWSGGEALCPPGFRPPDCLHQCPQGRYGLGCASMCPVTCYTPTCRPDSGHCYRCRLGFRGARCNKKCLEGNYGQDCIHTCGEHCLGFICDAFTGACQGCVPGFYGTRCDQVGEVTHTKSLLTKLLKDLWQRTNSTDSLASLATMQDRYESERRQPIIGESERQAFYTASLLICSIVPICLVGACLYLIKEKIKNALGGVLSKKRWTRARDGFFAKTIIPTSKSRFIGDQPTDYSKMPFVKFDFEDNTRNNHDIRSQTKGYVDQRIVSSTATKPDTTIDLSQPKKGFPRSNVRLSSSVSEHALGDVNRQHKAIQSDASVWTADLDTTVPVGHQNPKQGGFTTKPTGFWHRLIHGISWSRRQRPDNHTYMGENASAVLDQDTAKEVITPKVINPQEEAMLEAVATESSSSGEENSESSTSKSGTTHQAQDVAAQENTGPDKKMEEALHTSSTAKKRWRSPVRMLKLLSAFHCAKEDESGDSLSQALAAEGGSVPRQISAEKPFNVDSGNCQPATQNEPQALEDRNKMFEELLKRNVLQEIKLLQTVEETNFLPTRAASDHVLAKSTQTSVQEFSSNVNSENRREKAQETERRKLNRLKICSNPHRLRQEIRCLPPGTLRDNFLVKQLNDREETKSVASLSKMMSLKLKMAKMLGRLPGKKSGDPFLLRFGGKEPIDPMTLNDLCKIKLAQSRGDIPKHFLSHACYGGFDKSCINAGERSPDQLRKYHLKGKDTKTDSLRLKPNSLPKSESKLDGSLAQQISFDTHRQSNDALDHEESMDSFKRCALGHQHNSAVINLLDSLHMFQKKDRNTAHSEIAYHTTQDGHDAFVGQSKQTGILVNTSTSPRPPKSISHQTSPICNTNYCPLTSKTTDANKPTTSSSMGKGLAEFQVSAGMSHKQRDDLSRDQFSAPKTFCERSQSPGEVISKECPNPASPKTLGKSHLGATMIDNREEIQKLKETMKTLGTSHLTQLMSKVKDNALIQIAKAASQFSDDPTNTAQVNADSEQLNVLQKVGWKTESVEADSKNVPLHEIVSLEKRKENETAAREYLKDSPEKRTAPAQYSKLDEHVQVDKDNLQSRAIPFGNKELKRNAEASHLFPAFLTQRTEETFCPTCDTIFTDTCKQDPADKLLHKNHRRGDEKLLVTSNNAQTIHVPFCTASAEANKSTAAHITNRGRGTDMILKEKNELLCLNSPVNLPQGIQSEQLLNKENKCESIDETNCIAQSCMSSPDRARSGSKVNASFPLHEAAATCIYSQETMTFSDSVIKTPRSSDGECVVVHAYENFETDVQEDNGMAQERINDVSPESWSVDYTKKNLVGSTIPQSEYTGEKLHKSCNFTKHIVARDNARCTEAQSDCPQISHAVNVNKEVIKISETKKPEIMSSALTETKKGCSSFNTPQECDTEDRLQHSQSMISDSEHKSQPQKSTLQKERSRSPRKRICKPPGKEHEDNPAAESTPKTLPVPTLLEYSLQTTGDSLAQKVVNTTTLSKTSSLVSVPVANCKDTTTPSGLTLRDTEEFRSIQEPSSERYYDALEPDQSLWSRLNHGSKNLRTRKTRKRRDVADASMALANTSSSRPSKIKSRPSKHNEESTNTLFSFAPRNGDVTSASEKQRICYYKEAEGSDSTIVLRFARTSEDPKSVSLSDTYKRSDSCKDGVVDERRSTTMHDKRRNSSVGLDSEGRQRPSSRHCLSSDRKKKYETVAMHLPVGKAGESTKSLGSFANKKKHSIKEVMKVEDTDESSNQSSSNTLVGTQMSNTVLSKTKLMRALANQEGEPRVIPQNSSSEPKPNENTVFLRSPLETDAGSPSASLRHGYPQRVLYSEEPVEPTFYTQTFPRPRHPAKTYHYTQNPVPYYEHPNSNIPCHQTFLQSFPQGPIPSYPTPSQVVRPTGPAVRKPIYMATYNPNSFYQQHVDSSNFKYNVYPNTTRSYPRQPLLPAAVANMYSRSDRQGQTAPVNVLLRGPYGHPAVPSQSQQTVRDVNSLHNVRGEFVPTTVPFGARIPSSGCMRANYQLPHPAMSLQTPRHPPP